MKRTVVTFIIAVTCFLFVTTNAQSITGTFAIKNVKTSIFIRIKDANTKNGTPIVAYSPVNWKCVTWDFKKQEGNVYQLKNLFSGKTLQPKGAAEQGVLLEEQPLADGNAIQQYEFIAAGQGKYLIKLKGTELYLTPSSSDGEINAPIMLSSKTGNELQQWTLQEQHPTM